MNVDSFGNEIGLPNLNKLLHSFISEHVDYEWPKFQEPISIFPSAISTFYSPSDTSHPRGMHSERIQAISEWRGSKPRFDCAFIKKDTNYESLALPHRLDNLDVACIRLLLSFDYHGVTYQCIIIHGLLLVDDEPDEDTGMWLAHCPDKQISQAIPLNAIYCAAHLIPYYSNNSMP